jgi:hypothetical protein
MHNSVIQIKKQLLINNYYNWVFAELCCYFKRYFKYYTVHLLEFEIIN